MSKHQSEGLAPTFPQKMTRVHSFSHGTEDDLRLIKLNPDRTEAEYFGIKTDVVVQYYWQDNQLVEKQM